jgi:predicted nuclease of predicted toxin-antitoxin system
MQRTADCLGCDIGDQTALSWRLLDLSAVTKEQMKRLSGEARFYADQNLDEAFIDILRWDKLDVLRARDIGAEAQPDTFHYKYAFRHNRVLLTQDRDFLDEELFPLSQTCGVVIFNVDTAQPGQMARALEVVTTILAAAAPALRQKKFVINSDYSMTTIERVATASGMQRQTSRVRFDTNGQDVWVWEDE